MGNMASAAPEQHLDEVPPALIDWHGRGNFPVVRFLLEVVDRLAELVMSGYQRYPWGGVEVGGILLGKKESDTIHVYSFLPADCEHEHGPSFELSKRDMEGLDGLLPGAGSDEELKGLVPVGWYHSISRRELSLAKCDQALHVRLFLHRGSLRWCSSDRRRIRYR